MIRIFEIKEAFHTVVEIPTGLFCTGPRASRDDKYIRVFVKELPMEAPTDDIPVLIYIDQKTNHISHVIYYQDDFWSIYDFALDGHNVIEWMDMGRVPDAWINRARECFSACEV